MAQLPLYALVTYDGRIAIDAGSLRGRGVSAVVIEGPGIDVRLDVDPASGYPDEGPSPPFEVGATYELVLTLVTSSGNYATAITLHAGDAEQWASGGAGYALGMFGDPDIGSISPSTFNAPDIPTYGPQTDTPLYATAPFYPEQAGMCAHPSLTYDPAFQPTVDLRWLYVKSADGAESVGLIQAPDRLTPDEDVYLWLSPTGVPHFARLQLFANEGEFGRAEATLFALEPSPYGVVPAAPVAVIQFSYSPSTNITPATLSVYWDDRGEPVMTVAYISDQGSSAGKDIIAVATPGLTQFNGLTRGQFFSGGSLAFTDSGNYLTDVAEEF